MMMLSVMSLFINNNYCQKIYLQSRNNCANAQSGEGEIDLLVKAF